MRPRYRHSALWFLIPCLALLLPSLASAKWIDLGGDDPITVTVLSDAPGRTVYAIELGGFDAEPVTIQDDTYYSINLGGESRIHQFGYPELPDVRRAIMIADDRAVSVTILDSEHVDLPDMPVVPSKGHLSRAMDPALVAYQFDAFYQSSGTWPAQVVEADDPHIVRDVRGVVVRANVFQYTPGSTTLRVTKRLVVEVADNGPGQINVLHRDRQFASVDPQFRDLYRHHFLNSFDTRYTPVAESGGLLIIADDALASGMQPLLEWKLQKGLDTRMVTTSAIGSSFSQIKSYIAAQFADWAPAYVLLVGDITQIPVGSDSDPEHACILGSDDYPELFVGRFSANSASELATQVERTITYERDIVADRWMQRGTGIASSQGPGDDNEYDDEHEDNIRQKLLDYGYALVDQIYDPSGTAAQVATALNAGRGIINYTGHGSSTSWSSTGFSNTHVNALVNDNMLPFICSVACNNGTFTGTCFAEAWLRATNGGTPTGAIATYMSYISQSWDPPMCAQDHVTDLLVTDTMRTIGGLFFNGSCQMMDEYGSSGANEFLNWTIFGDPSLMVRTKEPEAMTVVSDGVLLIGMDSLNVQAAPGARCALYADGVLYGAAVADAAGQAVITMAEPPAEPMELTLTVTGYNKITDIRAIPVLPPEGPYLVLDQCLLDDAAGNGDGALDNGEQVGLNVHLENVGVETATGLSAVLSTEDPSIVIDVAAVTYGDIAAGGTGLPALPFTVHVDGTPPNGHIAQFTMQISGDGGVWDVMFNVPIEAPELAVMGCVVSDEAGGNGSGTADAGETIALQVQVANHGASTAQNLSGLLSCDHPDVIISAASGSAGSVVEGGQALLGTFEVQISAAFAEPSQLTLDLTVTDGLGYVTSMPLELAVGGWFDDMESDRGWIAGATGDDASSGLWVRAVPVGTSYDGAQVQPGTDHTPAPGTMCWVTGNGEPGGTAGANDVDGGTTTLLTPVFQLDGALSATVSYWRWYTNDAGNNPGEDWWRVQVTADGVTWVDLEATQATSAAWQNFSFDLANYVELTDQVQLRFVANDEGSGGSLVEAAVDDFLLDASYGITLGVNDDDQLPQALSLAGNHPNPFNPATTISFAVPRTGEVQLAVYDLAGRRVATLIDGVVEAGEHSIMWAGRDDRGQLVASGVYVCRLADGATTQTSKMLLMK